MEDLKLAYKLWFRVYCGKKKPTNKLRLEFDKYWEENMVPKEGEALTGHYENREVRRAPKNKEEQAHFTLLDEELQRDVRAALRRL